MKFVQPYFVVARREAGTDGAWELMMGEKAEQVFDWVLESGTSLPPSLPPSLSSTDLDYEFQLLEDENQ